MVNPTLIIAEAGVNHNGDIKAAIELIDIAANAGANAIKFQTFKAENLVTQSAAKAAYQQQQTGTGSQYQMLKNLELSYDAHFELIDYCKQKNIEFMSTAFDEVSLVFIVKLGIKRIKSPSGEITNRPFIEKMASYDLPIILSTGMSTLDETQEAIQWIQTIREQKQFNAPLAEKLSLLHCTSNYPTAYENVNLRAMQTLSQFGVPIGYSDHTLSTLVPSIAVAMGATIIEKHFTTDRTLPGPDHQASLEPAELTQMIQQVRITEQCLGDGIKAPQKDELPIRDIARKSVTLRNAKAKGSILTQEDLYLVRPGTGIPPKSLEELIGKKVSLDLQEQTTLLWEHIQG